MSLTETAHAGGHILDELDDNWSRENVTLKSGQNLGAGTVVGAIPTGTATETHAGNTGTGAMGAITVGSGAQAGTYRVVFVQAVTNAGNFEVFDPAGRQVGNGLVGAVFTGGGISFTIADSTDFVVGDKFLVTVVLTSLKYSILAPAGTDGTEVAAGVLYAHCDASAADKLCVITARGSVLNANEITWPGGITDAQKATATAQLAARGIILR